jgi:RNA recognition motif-containing protein
MSYKLFVGSVPGNAKSGDLLSLFRSHANVTKVKLAMDNKKKLCKGHGFVVCASQKDLDQLLQVRDKLFYRERLISLREFQKGSKLIENRVEFNRRRIFVGNVPRDSEAEDLAKIFSVHGEIEKIYLVAKEGLDGFRYGYVVYKSVDSADQVISISDTFFLKNAQLRVELYGGKNSNRIKPKRDEFAQENKGSSSGDLDLEEMDQIEAKASPTKSNRPPPLTFDHSTTLYENQSALSRSNKFTAFESPFLKHQSPLLRPLDAPFRDRVRSKVMSRGNHGVGLKTVIEEPFFRTLSWKGPGRPRQRTEPILKNARGLAEAESGGRADRFFENQAPSYFLDDSLLDRIDQNHSIENTRFNMAIRPASSHRGPSSLQNNLS